MKKIAIFFFLLWLFTPSSVHAASGFPGALGEIMSAFDGTSHTIIAWGQGARGEIIRVDFYVTRRGDNINNALCKKGEIAANQTLPDPDGRFNSRNGKLAVYQDNCLNSLLPGQYDIYLVLGPNLFAPGPYSFTIVTNKIDVPLVNLGIGNLSVFINHEKSAAVGDPQPNYEYSAHVFKMNTSPFYRMFYGGRCFYDASRNCQVPNVPYNPNQEYPFPNGGGNGDHIRYAQSDDGINFTRSLTPVIRPGKYEGVTLPSYDYDNHMDPTIIKWGDTYYMYYQVEVNHKPGSESANWSENLCPTGQQCDKILYATSPDLVTWTKHDQPVIINGQPRFMYAWPKAIVLDGKIWLYFGLMNAGSTPNEYNGGFLIKSTDPARFDFNSKIRQVEPFEWGQHAVLWPNDPQKRLHVQVMTNWPLYNTTGFKIPTLSFSKDGINWIYSDGPNKGLPITFPSYYLSKNHTFCNIATQINGELRPLTDDPNRIETFFYCATFSGFHDDVWMSDISAEKLVFQLPLPADLNSDGKVDIFDYNILVQNFGQTGSPGWISSDINKDGKVDIFDFNLLVQNFGK